MDYVVGSVAALISGNVTPNRPKLLKRALTPTKHQPSPNVTPKSEFVDNRSIFLSPTLQKKKEVAKKSPKRIFQNPDLDETNEDGVTTSPKADKVKKHLKNDLDAPMANSSMKSPKKGKNKLNKSVVSGSPKKNKMVMDSIEQIVNNLNNQASNENTPKKKKKRQSISVTEEEKSDKENVTKDEKTEMDTSSKKSKKKRKSENSVTETEITMNEEEQSTPKKKKQKKNLQEENQESNKEIEEAAVTNKIKSKKKKNKKNKKQKSQNQDTIENKVENAEVSPKKKKKEIVNPNAITTKDSDSEHESDNEIESETEKKNDEIFDKNQVEESSDEEEEVVKNQPKKDKKEKHHESSEEEIKRTIFVGNVPFSKKCKKEIKKIFLKHGDIETIRIRTVPVKDARVTPKVAVIKNELHPDRSTVNVYVKFKDAASVEKALSENNTVLNESHLRVTRTSDSGAHDSNRAIFVGNLPFALEDDGLRAKFEKCGEIDSVRIIRDRKTNAGKGFGYVNFTSKDGVELALSMTEEDLTIKNRIIRVKRCTHNTNKQKQGGSERKDDTRQTKPGIEGEGAFRRIMKKRQHQESGGGPPNKRGRITQPSREKKTRKEFVGMTAAAKKKKPKFTKGQKKKRILSEILTKSKE